MFLKSYIYIHKLNKINLILNSADAASDFKKDTTLKFKP
jgi:hypothetical protein